MLVAATALRLRLLQPTDGQPRAQRVELGLVRLGEFFLDADSGGHREGARVVGDTRTLRGDEIREAVVRLAGRALVLVHGFTQTGRAAMFRDYSRIHAQLARDRRVRKPYWKVQHGDLVSLVRGDAGAVHAEPPKGGELHLERLLGKVHDAIRGDITIPHSAIDDFVIRRSDGSPLYNLAVAVDDRDMGITHVVRGADLLSSTARQLLLYRALDLRPPVWIHDFGLQAADLQNKFQLGDPNTDLASVMLASSRAQVEFKGLVETRNRMVRAYQDIMNMPL